jgi:formylglycine-generating enzyme required for sulfatase activity
MKILFILIYISTLTACETVTLPRSDKGMSVIPVVNSTTNNKKIALIIGNRLYQYGTLSNTVNDATDIASLLKKMGFEVIFKTDLDQRSMDDALHQFRTRLSQTSKVGFFYFSGHGARVDGENYLVPIDNSRIRNERDLKYYAIAASKVLNYMQEDPNHVNIIVLDACRDNPYLGVSKGMKRGLTVVNPPRGSIISFATSPGNTASDISKNGRNGLFTSHLLSALKIAHKKHQRIDDMFMAVSDAVFRESKGEQEPWQLASLKRPYCFGGCNTASTYVPVPIPQPIYYNNKPKPGKVFRDRLRDGSFGPQMVWIPAGYFTMGDIQANGDPDEKPIHDINMKMFAIGRYEVTFIEYDKFIQATDRKKLSDNGWGRGKHPVIYVSLNDAKAYTKWLSKQTGYTYRLPSEAEWEYAARAGTKTNYWWGNNIGTNKANCYNCQSAWDNSQTAPVGSFTANSFGLYDTVGNVWEWTCSDYQVKYRGKELTCGNSYNIAVRGAAWNYKSEHTRVSNRENFVRTYRVDMVGFRILRQY